MRNNNQQCFPIDIFAKPSKKLKGSASFKRLQANHEAQEFFIDDFPFLKTLVPFGAGVRTKEVFVKNLIKALVEEETRPIMLAILRHAYDCRSWASQDKPFGGHLFIRCRKPYGQNVMIGFADFLRETMISYIENFVLDSSLTSVNLLGSDWIEKKNFSPIVVPDYNENKIGAPRITKTEPPPMILNGIFESDL